MNKGAKDIYIMGMPSIHTPSWTLLRNGKITCYIEEERLSRIKHQFGFFDRNDKLNVFLGWKYCLEVGGISEKDIDYLAFGFNPASVNQPNAYDLKIDHFHQERVFSQQYFLLDTIRKRFNCKAMAIFIRHHLAHAASVYYSSGYSKSLIITVDGWGEDETTGIFKGIGSKITQIGSVHLPNSLGNLYTQLTKKLGWGDDEAGKTMALAALGEHDEKPQFIRFGRVNSKYPKIDTSKWMNIILGVKKIGPRQKISNTYINLASQLQHDIELALIYLCQWAYKKTKAQNLCLAGGVAYNGKINYRILKDGIFQNVFLQPACGDCGISLGSALYAHNSLFPKKHKLLDSPYLGKEYNDDEILLALCKSSFQKHENDQSQVAYIGRKITEGKIIGWFQGRSEMGPRALGNRSILADPRDIQTKHKINAIIKNREAFRPFAPSILSEKVEEFFDINISSPYMLFIAQVKENKRQLIPAVIHVDSTARIQTVDRNTNPKFHSLIQEFYKLTDVPMLLNTSFNISGEPIVESPVDAVRTFLNTDLDILVINDYVIEK